jgi:hypothetical protein
VDDRHGVITAVASTPGHMGEEALLGELVNQHEQHTQSQVQTVVADSKYGTIENYLACSEEGITPHMADLQGRQKKGQRNAGIFPDTRFEYLPQQDVYRCPGGQLLRRRRYHARRQSFDYLADRGVCQSCPLRRQCTRGRQGRSIKRHQRQAQLDRARAQAGSAAAKADRRRRQHLMEGSFADAANNHGFKRSRWRRLWRQRIQDHLIAAVQNIRILLRHGIRHRLTSAVMSNARLALQRALHRVLPAACRSAGESSSSYARQSRIPHRRSLVRW